MRSDRREALLKLAVGMVVGLFVLDRAVLSPAITRWKEQGERIAALKEKVTRGKQLLERENSIRARWADMERTDLPEDLSLAESNIFKAISRWKNESRMGFTSLSPTWQDHPKDGYDTYECRATATGDQASIGRLIYEIETDPLPARIEECELSARDAQGKQVMLTARFSFIRISEAGRSKR